MKNAKRLLAVALTTIALASLKTYNVHAQHFSNNLPPVDMSKMRPSHPRVLVTDFNPIRQALATDSAMQAWFRFLCTESRMDALALRFNLTGDRSVGDSAYQAAARYDMAAQIKLGHHIYGQSMVIMGCAYDWLYGYMSTAQRDTLLGMLEQVLNAYLNDNGKYDFHNMNHVVNAGAMVAAIAIANEGPELSEKALNVALDAINLTWYKPDGVTPEGPHYMSWSSLYLIAGLASLESAFGDGFGLAGEPGLMGMGNFFMNATVPGLGVMVRYSDCYTNGAHLSIPQLFWIGNRFNRPDITQFALEYDKSIATGENADYTGKLYHLLWYHPRRFTMNPGLYKTLPLEVQFRSGELAVMRSGWGIERPLFAGIKGTDDYHQANYYHRHTNTGTFFLCALGENWAVDLGLESYNIIGYRSEPRLYYKLRAEGHNCNIINPARGIDNKGWEKCPIIAQGSNLQESYAIVDMTPDYKDITKSARRGLKLFDHRRKVLIQDEFVSLDGKPMDSYWFMQTEAGIDIASDGRSALLYKGKEKMLVYLATAPKGARFTVMGAEPLVYTRRAPSKQLWNFGAKKLTIHTSTETDLKLAVIFAPLREGETITAKEMHFQPLEQWHIPGMKEATLGNITADGAPLGGFDPRNFTYDVYCRPGHIPVIAATGHEGGKETVSIRQAASMPGKATVTVKADGMTPSSYFIYFREHPVQIAGSSDNEYSSWDESFANFRFVARPIEARMHRDYRLTDQSAVGAATIGFTNQQRIYSFELLGSNDGIHWASLYKGSSRRADSLPAAMPQLFSFRPASVRYIRVSNREDSLPVTIEIIQFHKNTAAAREHISHAHREVFSDVRITPTNALLKPGEQLAIKISGFSNYAHRVDLSDARISYESEKPSVASVSASGNITALDNGAADIRIIIQKGNVVLHKKIMIEVGKP